MKSRAHFLGKPVAIASVFLASILLVACEQSKQAAPAPAAAASLAATTEKVFVVFEGPWAFATDPKDANSVLALAPKTKDHRDLFVTATNNSTLASGVYDLSLPSPSGSAAGAFDPSFLRAKIDAANVQRVLDDKSSNRYAIRLPKPEAYVPASRFRSRAGATYPPDASTEKEYATGASLRYNVSNLSGFSLAGAPDTGTFNPLLLQVETPTIRFVIEPAQFDDPADKCRTHSRKAFHDLTRLLNLSLYVDFPDSPSDCQKKDPQVARPAKVEKGRRTIWERMAGLLEGNLAVAVEVSADGELTPNYLRFLKRSERSLARHLVAAWYLFGRPAGGCTAPVIGGS
ncbi:MAG: hypothetical protein WAQ52_14950 [Terriglobales bacterium]